VPAAWPDGEKNPVAEKRIRPGSVSTVAAEGALTRIIHASEKTPTGCTTLTRSASEGSSWIFPRLRCGLVFKTPGTVPILRGTPSKMGLSPSPRRF